MDKYIPRVGMLGTRHIHKYKYTDTQMQVYRCTDTIAQYNTGIQFSSVTVCSFIGCIGQWPVQYY